MAHKVMEYHNLPSAIQKIRKAGVMIQSKAEGLKTRGHCFSSRGQDQRTRSSSVKEQEKIKVTAPKEREFTLPLPFCSIQAPVHWLMPTHTVRADLLYSAY